MVSHESCHRQFALTGFTRMERMDLRMKIALLDGVCNENDVSGLFKVATVTDRSVNADLCTVLNEF